MIASRANTLEGIPLDCGLAGAIAPVIHGGRRARGPIAAAGRRRRVHVCPGACNALNPNGTGLAETRKTLSPSPTCPGPVVGIGAATDPWFGRRQRAGLHHGDGRDRNAPGRLGRSSHPRLTETTHLAHSIDRLTHVLRPDDRVSVKTRPATLSGRANGNASNRQSTQGEKHES